ncbi:VanZ family protein [bacterium]|nr:VanZ family protein [bacterium]
MMLRKLLDTPNWRVMCSAALLVLLAALFAGGAQPVAVGLIKEPWDKLAHATVFAVLAALLAMALHDRSASPNRSLGATHAQVAAVVLAALAAVTDELQQATLPGRVAGYDDLLADGLGIALGLLCVRWLWRRFAR